MREGNTCVLSWDPNCTDQNLEIAVNSRLKEEQLNGVVDVLLNDSTLVIVGTKNPHCIPANYRFKIRVFSVHHIFFEKEFGEFEDSFDSRDNLIRRVNNSKMIILYMDFSNSH